MKTVVINTIIPTCNRIRVPIQVVGNVAGSYLDVPVGHKVEVPDEVIERIAKANWVTCEEDVSM